MSCSAIEALLCMLRSGVVAGVNSAIF